MDHRLTRVLERLGARTSQRVRLPALAREMGMSIRSLESLFTKDAGKPFSVRYREMRIAIAKHLLERTDQQVKEIAAQLGYTSVAVFCRDFKRMCGRTAIEYRKSVRKEICRKSQFNPVD